MFIRIDYIHSPDCPDGVNTSLPVGSRMRRDRTAALFPQHGSRAIGLGESYNELISAHLYRHQIPLQVTSYSRISFNGKHWLNEFYTDIGTIVKNKHHQNKLTVASDYYTTFF
jgi:hypothetical protein